MTMTAYIQSAAAPAAPLRWAERLRVALRRRAAFIETRDELRGLSDRDLADLGVARENIDGAARASVGGEGR